ncbi:MAG: two-component system chemotaxis sensor kinase CheA [Candidatus Pseudothioglobus sp.]|jgi:two-component system chemotaxis sensor kinase CheA
MTDDEEILQDFLVEAGEILEQLSEQLVGLERSPDDAELLNAIFRGFHTVKGGAGFLQLDAMVDLCHNAENIFDNLRKGECVLTSETMDSILQTTDVVNVMFDEIRAGHAATPAAQDLLDTLARLAAGVSAPEWSAVAAVVEAPVEVVAAAAADVVSEADKSEIGGDNTISDDEFEKLLDALAEDRPLVTGRDRVVNVALEQAAPVDSNEISDAEFEALLDQLDAAPSTASPAEVGLPYAAERLEANATAAAIEPTLVEKKAGKGLVKGVAQADSKVVQKEVAESTVRVDTRRLDDIMNMVGELVLVRNRLVRLGLNSADEALCKAVGNLDVVTADLQTSVMKTRMQPIKKVFGRFPRVVRDLARSLHKEISLEMIGEDTDLDKNLVEALADPLVHLVRNSVDHGIELPEDRVAAGKPRTGTIVLAAQQEGDHIQLTIRDDGKGMDPDLIREIAVKKGVIDRDSANRLSDSECFNLIFAVGFSTKEEVSDVSGRGVGMDVVKTKINQLNGSVNVESTLGEGSLIVIKVPLTLAIMPTLMVMLDDQTFALPLVSVNEIFHLDLSATNVVDGQEVIIVRDKAVPLYYLKKWLVRGGMVSPANDAMASHVVIVSVGNRRVGFVVDQLIGQEEVVIKPLGKMLQGTHGMAGATITGDGAIALILDVPGMLKRYG